MRESDQIRAQIAAAKSSHSADQMKSLETDLRAALEREGDAPAPPAPPAAPVARKAPKRAKGKA